jgi:hypothetical protein
VLANLCIGNFARFLFVIESMDAYCLSQDSGWPGLSFTVGHHGDWTTETARRGGTVGVSEILAQIDREIAQLQRARALLSGSTATPKKAAPAAAPAAKKAAKKKRNLTPEGRKRIAEAVKRRWAEQKKTVPSK